MGRLVQFHRPHCGLGGPGRDELADVAAQQMREAGQSGAIVSILCDGGERYAHSYYNPQWYEQNGIDVTDSDQLVQTAAEGGKLPVLDWV